MFKRVTTFLTVLFMGLVLTVRSPVKADTFSIPFSAIPDLLNAFYTVAAGGKIEFSALIGDITGIDDFLENLHDYYNEHYTQPLLQSTQGLIDIGLSGLALEGIDCIDNINNISIPITPQDIANFISYDVNWADRYNDVEEVVINPDHNYDSYINIINGRYNNNSVNSFYWFNYSQFGINPHTRYYYSSTLYPYTDYSFCSISSSAVFGTPTNVRFLPITDINIISSSENVYNFSLTVTPYKNVAAYHGSNGDITDYYDDLSFNLDNTFQSYGSNAQSITFSYSGTLAQVFNYIGKHFKNVNIYVDGELWSYVNDIEYPGISLNDSTAVGDTGNITYGVYPLTHTGDIGLDLAKWGEYIFNKFISGTDTLTMDTVIDDGWDLVNTDDGERAITEEDEEDVAKVIHGFVDTTATTPTPTPDIGDPPVLKIIPPILELPDEIWPNGGRDTTVLAQMIHATDVAIPNDIMTVIWSTIGLLVVGGLISILHK